MAPPWGRSLVWAMLVAFALSLRIPAVAADDPLGEARTLNHQAVELYNQGRYPEAEALEKRAPGDA
jgi:hypothetical protein